MQPLQIDPPTPFIVPPGHVNVTLVGCGGTGSHIAQSLARLAAHCRDTGSASISNCLIEGDRVENRNVGRQLFSVADVGKNKAQVLAARFSAVFGLGITAVPQMLEPNQALGQSGYGILVGAVDGAAGRRAIANQLDTRNWRLWIDCGNHEHSGQVVVGTTLTSDHMHKAVQLGMCAKLPVAPLLYPELLKDVSVRPREDCAAAMEDNAQSLMVNQMMAGIASQYLYQIVVQRRLTTFQTVIDLSSLSMRSTPITVAQLASACNVPIDHITGTKTTKAKKVRNAA
jgi:PRTRC genetic system ThiF family protein